MGRKSKCKGCDKLIIKEEKFVHSNKTYCKECYDQIQLTGQSYNLLIKTICEYLNVERPTGLIFKQMKEYKDQLGYSYDGMVYTMWYIKSIEGKSFSDSKYGIALVKYSYEKARNYFNNQQKIEASVRDSNDNGEEKINVVKVNMDKVYVKKKDFVFNLDELIKEG